MAEVTIKKADVVAEIECYRLRFDNSEWADIYLDAQTQKSGALIIRSDFGDWAHHWGALSEPIKQSLSHMDTQYLTGKLLLDRSKEFHLEKWIEDIKASINNSDEEDDHKGLLLSQINNEVTERHFTEPNELSEYLQNSTECTDLWEYVDQYHEYPKKDQTPRQLQLFIERIWPVFVSEIKRELAEVVN